MASAEQTLTEYVPAAPGDVRDFYVDLNNIAALHPLVTSVRTIARTELAHGYRQDYRVQDRIPLGPFNLRIRYVARVQVPARGDVLTEARQFPRVRLRSRVSFQRCGAGTRVVERIRVQAPRPLGRITMREAVTAHVAMLAGIRRRFESARPGA